MAKKAEKAKKTTAEQILSAGKAAVDKAQEAVEKAQKESDKLIKSLTKESDKVREQTQKLAEEAVDEMKEKVEEVKTMATDTLENLEKIFEDRVSRVLNRLGVPTSSDFKDIARRIEELNASVQDLIESGQLHRNVGFTLSATADDLKKIEGIGPAIEAKLNAAGINSYRQIAELDPEGIESIENQVIHYSGRIGRDKWVEQSRELHLQKYDEPL